MFLKMRNALKSEKMILIVYISMIALLFVVYPLNVYAGGNPFDSLVGKFDNLKDTILSIAKILAFIGIVIGGIKKVLGHPDAFTWLWSSALGAFIIFSADAILSWISAT